ncbi:hypothetical protein [Nocardia sp. NPDC051832]|uniref:DUF7373 family lipoprotein n=1 Tax=Nocardia sp. NPDC051832 TaxID=3155673 RepID=UPI00341F32EA
MKVLWIVALVLAVCGCTVVGRPVPGPDPAALDVGPYSRNPMIAPVAVSDYHGRVLESVRMAEAMAVPETVDPALRVPLGGPRAVPLPTAAKASGLLANPTRAVLERHGMLAGYTVGATDSPDGARGTIGAARLLQIIVLRFPDGGAAQQAAQEIDAVDFAVSPDNIAVPIAGHPAARGHWRPAVPTLAATVAHESFVISVLAGDRTPDLAALSTLAAKAFDTQIPLLKSFTPTPAGRFAELALDRDAMLGRMVPEAPGRWPFPQVILGDLGSNAGWGSLLQASGVVYGPQGAVLSTGPAEQRFELLALNRFDRLVRFADADAARKHFAKVLRPADDSELPKIPVPTGLVDIDCRERPAALASNTRFQCLLRYGRYMAAVFSRDYDDVRHRAAAQYALLVNSE